MTSKAPRYIILIGDGMGDLPLPELGNRTPLEHVATPAMDFVAGHGELVLLKTVPDGYPPGSDVANLSLLGYQPELYYTGRAPLEAASMGVALKDDEIAFRCNLVTLDWPDGNGVVMKDYSAGHIPSPEASELIKALNQTLACDQFRFYPGVSYRHLLVCKGDLNVETVPPHDHTGREVTACWRRYLEFPQLDRLLTEARAVLADHPVNRERIRNGRNPANAIWLWGQGRAPSMPTLREQYGISGALISAVDLLKGIGVYAGMEIVTVPGATGYLDTNYAGKVEAALEALARNDLVFVHVEAPDEAAHQGSLPDKIKAIEDFDRHVVQPVLNGLERRGHFRLVVAMDHFTPLASRTHADLPVPVALYDSQGAFPASGRSFTEANARRSGIVLPDGRALFRKFLSSART